MTAQLAGIAVSVATGVAIVALIYISGGSDEFNDWIYICNILPASTLVGGYVTGLILRDLLGGKWWFAWLFALYPATPVIAVVLVAVVATTWHSTTGDSAGPDAAKGITAGILIVAFSYLGAFLACGAARFRTAPAPPAPLPDATSQKE
jgi:hypothetical protein